MTKRRIIFDGIRFAGVLNPFLKILKQNTEGVSNAKKQWIPPQYFDAF